jgi:hypothetical protein
MVGGVFMETSAWKISSTGDKEKSAGFPQKI